MLSAQELNLKPYPEPTPTPASASEMHNPAGIVYPTPLYYNDVTIESSPSIDQRNVKLTVAFNGWLYTAFNTVDSALDKGGITIRMSRDNGQSWTTIDNYSVTGVRYPTHDIVVCGTDTNNLVVYLVGVNHTISSGNYVLFVDRYNGRTGAFNGSNYSLQNGTRPVYDVALATDYLFPAVGASPYSVGLLYSTYSSMYDSIVFLASVDGGTSWSVREPVATTGSFNRKVSLAYGRSASASNGRYFAAWEQIGTSTARTGHIYTSRNQTTVDGPWISKQNLDSVSSTMINLCRNPQIAVQYNNTDNDSGAVTAIVLVDRDYLGDGSDYDMLGFYNKRAHFTNFWNRLDIVNTSENDMQADITYDPGYNNFLGVYYDSTNGKLPYIVNGYNLSTPNSWVTITGQYNDVTTNLKAPYPRVEINPLVTQAAHAWNAEGVLGRGVSMFDAEYVVAGINNSAGPRGGNVISVYPSPSSEIVNVSFINTGEAIVNVYTSTGALVESRSSAVNSEQFNVSGWSSGMYIIEVVSNNTIATTRCIVQH